LVAPVGALGFDAVRGEDLAGAEVDDRDLMLIDDGEDAATAMGGADAQVMEATGPAQGHGPGLVDEVVAQAEGGVCPAPGRLRLRSRPVGLTGRPSADGPVRSRLVVGDAEGIELRLQLGERPCRRLLAEPALEVCWTRSILPWVWG